MEKKMESEMATGLERQGVRSSLQAYDPGYIKVTSI